MRVTKAINPILELLASNERTCRYIADFFSSRQQRRQLLNKFLEMFPHLSVEGLSDREIESLVMVGERTKRLGVRVIYDVGANEGLWSVAFSETGPDVIVHAFEPLPDIYASLIDRISHKTNIIPHNIAFGRSWTITEMYQNDFHPSSSLLRMSERHIREYPHTGRGHPVAVTVESMDEYVGIHKLPMPDLVKIDVQGYEDHVIAGGREVLCHARYIWIEVSLVPLYDNSATFHSTYSALNDIGFELRDIFYLDRSTQDQTLLQMDAIFCNSENNH